MSIGGGVIAGLLISAALLNALIGLLVLLRNAKDVLHRYFFGLSTAIAAWATTNVAFQYVSDGWLLSTALLSYGTACLIAGFFLLFTAHLYYGRTPGFVKTFAGLSFLSSIASAIPGWIAVSVDSRSQIITNKLQLGLYGCIVLFSLLLAGWFLVRLIHTSKGEQKQRARFIVSGLAVAGTIGLTCNLVFPLYGNYNLVAIGPTGSIALVLATAYTIVKHRLFDVRLVVTRALAYLISLIVLASIYGVIVFGVLKIFFDREYRVSTQIIFSIATALAAIGFNGLKSFFDKVTSKLFYRDAYDTQELLDNLNRLFVAKTDLNELLKQSARVISDNFKAEFCYFGIRESETAPQRVIGSVASHVTPEQIELVRRATPHIHHKIIVADDLEGAFLPLKAILDENGIAVLGRLTANVHRSVEGLGYLVLGQRRSGNPYTARDLRTLEIIVNEVVIATENSLRFEEIQHFNETLQANVSDATRKLRSTNDKLKTLDATKDEFITMASHQLRTPLTAVKGYLSMVLEGDAGKLNAQQRKLLEQSYASSQRMVYLIADLLNLSRLSTGKFVIDPSPTNLAEVVQSEIDQLVETARSREIGLHFKKPEAFPDLMLDETKTHQVVMNFIDNAIYYTPAGGDISVDLADHGSYVEYTVTDTGIGVPKSEQRHLFSKFYRAENARQARPDGTGLGLFMAKKVIVEQKGALIFNSTEGKGSTFGFRFNKKDHTVDEIN